MEIIAIDKTAFDLMKDRFDSFTKEVDALCSENTDSPEWIDNEVVCQLLGISKRTLQNYRNNGTLAYSQIGYKCYYKVSDVKALIEKSIIKKE